MDMSGIARPDGGAEPWARDARRRPTTPVIQGSFEELLQATVDSSGPRTVKEIHRERYNPGRPAKVLAEPRHGSPAATSRPGAGASAASLASTRSPVASPPSSTGRPAEGDAPHREFMVPLPDGF